MQRHLATSSELAHAAPLIVRIGRLILYAALFTAFWGGRWHRATVQSPIPGLTPGSPQFAAVVLGAFMLAGLALAGPRGIGAAWRGPRKWISVGLLGLSFLSLLTAPFALDPMVALKASLRLALLWFIFAAVNQLASDDEIGPTSLPAFAASALALGMALQGLVAVLQFIRQGSVGLAALGEMDLNPLEHGVSVLQTGGQAWLRGYGLAAHPNVAGGYLAAGLLALLGLPALLRAVIPRVRWAWGLPLLGVGAAGLIVTFSRSAWLGCIAGLVFLGLALGPRYISRERLLVALSVGVLTAIITFASVGDLLLSRLTPGSSEVESTSIQERLEFQALAVQVIREYPFGVGGDNFPLIANEKLHNDRQARPHTVPLLIVAELGPLGGLFWFILTLVPPVVAWRRVRQAGRNPVGARLRRSTDYSVESRKIAPPLVFAACLVAVAVISLFDHYFWSSVRGTMFWALLLGLWSASLTDEVKP